MKHKKLKIAISVIVGLLVIGFALYKISFNVLAPVVFDFVVSKNPEALLKLEDNEQAEIASSETENKEIKADNPEEDKEEKKEENKENKKEKDKTTSTQKSNSYTTETYIGTLTSADMATVIKNISAADKTRIISICKSVVAPGDMPRFAKMATQGMSGGDYAYAESYLRSHLSPGQKKEIMEIVRKYLGR